MHEISDKLLLMSGCLTLYILQTESVFFIVPAILSVVLSSLFIYFDAIRIRLAGSLLFCLLCFFTPGYIIYLPLILYDILHTRYQPAAIAVPFLFIYSYDAYTPMVMSLTTVLLVVSFSLKYKTDRLLLLTREYNELRDSSAQISKLLEEKNQSLLKNQDYEVNLATLNERSRISKELHDSIGHILSRTLLQVGALLTITKEEITRDGLSALKASLSEGMDQIRSSIHNMYDDSIDLYVQIEHLVKGFTFCSVTFDYDIKTQPTLPLKHSLIAIAREGLSNIIRHSNATKASIILREHPAMYQLIIQDNGITEAPAGKSLAKSLQQQEYGEGMGVGI